MEFSFSLRAFFLGVALLLLGALALVTQVLFIREFLVVFYGNELCLGIVFAGWFVSIAIGAWLGGHVAGRLKGALAVFILLQVAMCLLPALQIALVRLVRALLSVPPGEYIALLPLAISSFLLIFPFSFAVGFIFPFACKASTSEREGALTIGWVYVLEALGSLIGGCLLTYYLILRFEPFEIVAFIALAVLGNGIVCALVGEKGGRSPGLAAFCLLLLAATAWSVGRGYPSKLEAYTVEGRWATFSSGITLLESVDSRYENIVVAKTDDQISVFGNGQYMTSFPDPYAHAQQAHFILTQHPSPREVLLIGGGFGGLIGEMLKHGVERLDYVELDPKLLDTVFPYLPEDDKKLLKAGRVNVIYVDGRYFVKRGSKEYDVVVVNLPDPSTAMLNRFYTKEFFEEVKRILKKGGLMVTGISSAVNYIGEEVGVYSGSLYWTLHDVFDHVMVTPGDRNYFFASLQPGITTTDSGVLAKRYEERGISSAFFSPALFGSLLPRERLTFIEESLKRREDLTLNTDGRPITYFHHLRLWEIFSGREGGGASFYSLIPKGATWYWITLFGFLVVRVLYVPFRGRAASGVLRFNCLLAILTTGLAGMAMEIVLIFSFQNVYGYVYQKVGLIVAFFMFGLALGGFLMNRLIARGAARWVSVLTGLEALILIYVLGLPFVLDLSSSLSFLHEGRVTLEAVFAALVAVAGFLTGVEFPLVSKIILAEGEELGRAAGRVDAFDHLGACIGAFLMGTVLVPVLGVFQSCALIAALKGASLVLLLLYLAQKKPLSA